MVKPKEPSDVKDPSLRYDESRATDRIGTTALRTVKSIVGTLTVRMEPKQNNSIIMFRLEA